MANLMATVDELNDASGMDETASRMRCIDCKYYREEDIEHMTYRFCSLMDEGVNEGDSCWVCMEKGGEQDE